FQIKRNDFMNFSGIRRENRVLLFCNEYVWIYKKLTYRYINGTELTDEMNSSIMEPDFLLHFTEGRRNKIFICQIPFPSRKCNLSGVDALISRTFNKN